MHSYKNTSAVRSPTELLYQIAETVEEAKAETGVTDLGRNSWQGVAFSLCGQRMVAQLGEVVEILTLPEFTKVHGAEPWLMGIANIRSQLVTLIDLEAYFGSGFSANKKNLRVLIVDDGFSKLGLVVSKVYGLRNFRVDDFKPIDSESGELLAYCMDAVVESANPSDRKSQQWHRFSIDRMINTSQPSVLQEYESNG